MCIRDRDVIIVASVSCIYSLGDPIDYRSMVISLRPGMQTVSYTHLDVYKRQDLHRLWKVKSCVDTAARFNERTEEQMLQNRPQTRHKKEDISR